MCFWRSLFETLACGARPEGRQQDLPGEGRVAADGRTVLAFDRWAERNFTPPS
jgi:hypothetical protein